jgi:hypothetical protein
LDTYYEEHSAAPEEWLKKNTGDNNENDEILNSHIQWCIRSKITKTPTLYFEGRELALPYSLEDLQYLIA